MERLTERIDNVPDGESGVWVKNHDYVSAAEKLAEYEDLEEQDRLTKLPCKVGDTVYGISMGKFINLTVNEISIFCMKGEKIINVKCQSGDEFRNYVEREFGKTVFLTKSEAEAAMNRFKGINNKDIERD